MKKKNNFYYIVTALLLVLLFLAVPGVRGRASSLTLSATAWMTSPLYRLSTSIKSNFTFLANLDQVKRKNEELADKLLSMQVDEARITELTEENKILTEELGFYQNDTTQQLVPARVIEREPLSFLDSLIIDKGSRDGVRLGAAVLSKNILVGEISDVYDTTSRVTLITSKDSIVQAMLQTSRAKGILRGGIAGLFLENIVSDTEYTEGEYVVTSGLGGKIKEGIIIAKAGKIESSTSGIFKSIAAEPIVDISKLELVFIQK